MSPLRMWLNSCPITPCNSSRLSASSVPRVTTTAAWLGEKPAAKALMVCWSSITKTCGTAVPEAIAISSTTFSSLRSAGSLLARDTGRAPIMRARTAPPPARRMVCARLPPPISANVASVTIA